VGTAEITSYGCSGQLLSFTPHQYLLRLRIEKAQSLMKDRSLRMINIAESCGFASQSQVSRVFKQVVGVSPKQYRP
jgi:AraC family transcriptional regulator